MQNCAVDIIEPLLRILGLHSRNKATNRFGTTVRYSTKDVNNYNKDL